MAELKLGDSGPEVQELQELVNFWSSESPTAVDGNFGPGTEAKLKQYQEVNEPEATGIATDETIAALRQIRDNAMNDTNILKIHDQVELAPDGGVTCYIGNPTHAINASTQQARFTVFKPDGSELFRQDLTIDQALAPGEYATLQLSAYQYEPGDGYVLRVESNPDHVAFGEYKDVTFNVDDQHQCTVAG